MDFDFTTESITPNSVTILKISSTGALDLPSGTTAQRPGGIVAGGMRWNTDTPGLEYYNGSTWSAVGGGGGGTPGGSTTQVQFNNTGAFAGSANLTVDTGTGELFAASGINLSGANSMLVLNSSIGAPGEVLVTKGALNTTPEWRPVAYIGTATIDFGAAPGSNEANVFVNVTNLNQYAPVMVWVNGESTTTDHTANDHRYFTLFANLTVGIVGDTGFALSAYSTQKLTGAWEITYSYTLV